MHLELSGSLVTRLPKRSKNLCFVTALSILSVPHIVESSSPNVQSTSSMGEGDKKGKKLQISDVLTGPSDQT